MKRIKQLMSVYLQFKLKALVGFLCVTGFAYAYAADDAEISGVFVSDIVVKQKTYDEFFGKRKYRKLELSIRQDGPWIMAIDEKFGTRISGYRQGNRVKFEIEPGKVINYYNAFGEWEVSAGGAALDGTWKGNGGSSVSAGNWHLKKTADLPSNSDMPVLSNEVSFSDLVLGDGNGNETIYTGIVSKLHSAHVNQSDLPRKTLKIKSLPEDLMWLGEYDNDKNGTVNQNEICQAWLIKLAELKSGNDYSSHYLRIVTQDSSRPKKAPCVPMVHRKAVYKHIMSVLSDGKTRSMTAKSTLALLNHLDPGSISGDRGGDGGGGDGGDGGGGEGGGM